MNKREELIVTLARCRVIDKELLEQGMASTESLAELLVEEKLANRLKVNLNGEEKVVYSLSEKGESAAKHLSCVNELYRGFDIGQDLVLCNFYLRLTGEQRESWVTRDDLIKQYQLTGTVDGAYRNESGELVSVKTLSAKSGYPALKRVEDFMKQTNLTHIHYLMYEPTI